MSTLFAFLHHLAAFLLFGALMVQFVTLRDELGPRSVQRLKRADRLLGASATALLVVGLLRVFYFEKGPAYYWDNAAFLAKFTVFIAVALLSIYPTVRFIAWGRAGAAASGVRAVKAIVHAELAAVVLLMLLGAMMARGIG